MTCRSCGEIKTFPESQGWTHPPGAFLRTALVALLLGIVLVSGALVAAVYFEGKLGAVVPFLLGVVVTFLVALTSLVGCLLSWLEYSSIPETMKGLFVCERCGVELPVYPWTR